MAYDDDSNEVMLDREIVQHFDAALVHEGAQVSVSTIDGAVCTVSTTVGFEIGDEFVQRIFISETNEVLNLFTQHWKPRWNLLSQLSESDWMRIVQFTQAFLPQHQFQLPTIDVTSWRRAVRKFKPKAARGPDGFAKLDLIHMPESYVQEFLNMLHSIECADTDWPQQLLFGMIIGLAKRQDAHEESHYRPITLFPCCFQMLVEASDQTHDPTTLSWMPAEALGFLPHREAAEIWLPLQGQIELMLACDETDVAA